MHLRKNDAQKIIKVYDILVSLERKNWPGSFYVLFEYQKITIRGVYQALKSWKNYTLTLAIFNSFNKIQKIFWFYECVVRDE